MDAGQEIGVFAAKTAIIVGMLALIVCIPLCCLGCIGFCKNKSSDTTSSGGDTGGKKTKREFKFTKYQSAHEDDLSDYKRIVKRPASTNTTATVATPDGAATAAAVDGTGAPAAEATSAVLTVPLIEVVSQTPPVVPVATEKRGTALVLDIDCDKSSIDDLVITLAAFVRFVLRACDPKTDVVLFRITSPGGSPASFQYGYSHMQRLREKGFRTVALIDTMAASGGYMLACGCNEIVAAPTATVGSIGVIMQGRNIKGLLDKIGIRTYEMATSPYKNMLSSEGDVTEHNLMMLREKMDDHFRSFKALVSKNRPRLNAEIAFTARDWLAEEAVGTGLVDKLQLSDDFLDDTCKTHDVIMAQPTSSAGMLEWVHKITELW